MRNDGLILTDCDGVLLDWHRGFVMWMSNHGYEPVIDPRNEWDMATTFDITPDQAQSLIGMFNESAYIAYLKPLRDAMYYIDKLHRKHGYVFHVITSMSDDPYAQKARIDNLERLFGKTVFEKYKFLGTGCDKHSALEEYRDSGLLFVEDKPANVDLGLEYGLNAVIVDHGYNQNYKDAPRVYGWKDIYNEFI